MAARSISTGLVLAVSPVIVPRAEQQVEAVPAFGQREAIDLAAHVGCRRSGHPRARIPRPYDPEGEIC